MRYSYEALGLLSQIPLAKGLNKGKAAEEEEDLSELVSGYGQIIRDAEGNVIDIILPEEPQGAEQEDEEKEVPKVEAKTAIAKSQFPSLWPGKFPRLIPTCSVD